MDPQRVMHAALAPLLGLMVELNPAGHGPADPDAKK
jgi:hypothetical protein